MRETRRTRHARVARDLRVSLDASISPLLLYFSLETTRSLCRHSHLFSFFFFSRLSELLVGAPFFSDDLNPEKGRVYVYENNGNGNLSLSLELPITASKNMWRANFGRAISAVGDIDLDGFQGKIFFSRTCLH